MEKTQEACTVWQSRWDFPTGRLNMGCGIRSFSGWVSSMGPWVPTSVSHSPWNVLACRITRMEGGRTNVLHWGHQSQVRESSTEEDQSALHIIGYHTSRKELRDVYHSVYLLNRAPGSPSCGEVKQKRAIWEILSLLQERLWRWTFLCTDAKDAPENKMGLASSPTYEVALWEVCHKVVETTASLQNDLDRLNNEMRGRLHGPIAKVEPGTELQSGSQHRRRSRGHSRTWSESWRRAQAGSLHWEHSQGGSGDQAGAQSQDYCQVGSQDMNGLIFETVARDPNIRGSTIEYLKVRIWQQRTGNLPSNHPLRT